MKTLSEKIQTFDKAKEWNCVNKVLDVRNVKETVRRLKDKFEDITEYCRTDIIEEIDKIFGKELT